MGNYNLFFFKNEVVLDGYFVIYVEVGEDIFMFWLVFLDYNFKYLKRFICFNVFLNLLEFFFRYRKIFDYVKLF